MNRANGRIDGLILMELEWHHINGETKNHDLKYYLAIEISNNDNKLQKKSLTLNEGYVTFCRNYKYSKYSEMYRRSDDHSNILLYLDIVTRKIYLYVIRV